MSEGVVPIRIQRHSFLEVRLGFGVPFQPVQAHSRPNVAERIPTIEFHGFVEPAQCLSSNGLVTFSSFPAQKPECFSNFVSRLKIPGFDRVGPLESCRTII